MTKHFSMPAMLMCLFFSLMSGCSSLHVDVGRTTDWTQVKVVQFQSQPENLWQLNQPIKSELQTIGFEVTEAHPNPDLLFSYFTQESPDLTVESEILVRLKSLHVQFVDPATKTRVAAADYFYPETTDPTAPETGVRELFAELRQQILNDNRRETEPVASAVSPAPSPQTTKGQPESINTEAPSSQAQAADNVVNTDLSNAPEARPLSQEQEVSTPTPKTGEAVQKTRSPWLPKFKSWGFENWGEQDSVGDY